MVSHISICAENWGGGGGGGEVWLYDRVRTLIYAQIVIIPSTAKTTKKMTDNPSNTRKEINQNHSEKEQGEEGVDTGTHCLICVSPTSRVRV
jgi:hypothetical protein